MNHPALIVLAAGEGKRIKPIITSKPLLPFMGRTLLSRVIEGAQVLKPKQVVIVTNPNDQESVQKLFPQAKIAVQLKPDGMAGAVKAASGINPEGPAVIMNGDDWIDGSITKAFSQQITATPDKVVLTGIKADLTGGYFDIQGSSLKVVEKPTVKPSEWAKLVLDYLPDFKALLAKLGDDYEAGLNQLDLNLVKTEGKFYQLKFPWQILELAAGLLTGENQIDPTAKVGVGSYILNSYLGPNVVVGQNCLVRDSIVEAGTVIGFGTEIARSYIGPNNWFHRNYVGDSVIEGGSNFGAGAVTANFRFDHKPVGASGRVKFGAVVGLSAQVGVNASLMPGANLPAGKIARAGEVYR